MSKKRGNSEGSVYRRADGKWAGAVTLGFNEQGNPRRKVVYGGTRAEAARKLADLLDKHHKGLLAEPTATTVADFAQDWLRRRTLSKARSTQRNYRLELGYACRYLGRLRLQSVKPTHVQAMLDALAADGYSPRSSRAEAEAGAPRPPKPYSTRTQRMVLQRLSAVFQDALRMELIHRNPCAGVRVELPPAEPVGRALEPGEIAALLAACEGHPMGPFFRLVLDTGLRKGEALALTWGDVDLEADPPRLTVSRSWTCGPNGGYFTRPKSRRSRRTVPLPRELADRLEAQRLAAAETYGPTSGAAHLFGDPVTGRPFNTQSPNVALTRICKRQQFTHVRVHDLRHTYGSVLLSLGVPVEVVSERMGHADPTITLKVYRHLLERERTDYVYSVTATARPPGEAPKPDPDGHDDQAA